MRRKEDRRTISFEDEEKKKKEEVEREDTTNLCDLSSHGSNCGILREVPLERVGGVAFERLLGSKGERDRLAPVRRRRMRATFELTIEKLGLLSSRGVPGGVITTSESSLYGLSHNDSLLPPSEAVLGAGEWFSSSSSQRAALPS